MSGGSRALLMMLREMLIHSHLPDKGLMSYTVKMVGFIRSCIFSLIVSIIVTISTTKMCTAADAQPGKNSEGARLSGDVMFGPWGSQTEGGGGRQPRITRKGQIST